MNMRVLNRKESKEIVAKINVQFGATFELDKVLFMNGDDLYLANREAIEGIRPSWRVNELGLYLGEVKGDQVRMSIEGSQLVGATATKNIVEIDEDQLRSWLGGVHVEFEASDSGYVLVRYNSDFVGCGKIKQNKLLNFVPKARRVNLAIL